MNLTIGIPTFNNPEQLAGTLYSLTCFTEYPFKVIVVNNSGDPEMEQMVDQIVADLGVQTVSVVHAGQNLGWMGGINRAFEECDTELFCMMNDDLVFPASSHLFFRYLCDYFKHETVGAVGPCSNFVMGSQNLFLQNVHTIASVSVLIGFCMVVRSSLFRELGMCDEHLPGGDDLDLSIRIKKAGYDLVMDRRAYVHHIGQQTGPRVEAGWDNPEHQETVNNALIRKHGVIAWHECRSCQWGPWVPRHPNPEETLSPYPNEKMWIESVTDTWEGMACVDVGCGHTPKVGVGLDMARAGEAGAGGRKWDGAAPTMTGDATDLPLQTESLDRLVACHVIEHLIDPPSVLKEWERVLKPGGKALIACPHHGAYNTMLIDHTHVHAYTPNSLTSLLEVCGWEVEESVVFENNAFAIVATPGKEAAHA